MVSRTVSYSLIYFLKKIHSDNKFVLEKLKQEFPEKGQFDKVQRLCISGPANSSSNKFSLPERIYLVVRLLFLYEYDSSVKNTIPKARYEERVKALHNIIENNLYISKSRLQDIYVEVFGLKQMKKVG